MKATSAALLVAAVCLLAASDVVDGRVGSARQLQAGSRRRLGGCFANGGNGITGINTVLYGAGKAVLVDTGYYNDGYVVYLAGGIVFGTIYGGVIYPPAKAVSFPPAIVKVVVFGPVFAQSVFIGPSGSPNFCNTIFYGPNRQRIYNPASYSGVFYNDAGAQLGSFNGGYPCITSTTIINQYNINVNIQVPARTIESPEAAHKEPISSAVGQDGVTVTPGAAPASTTPDAVQASEVGMANPNSSPSTGGDAPASPGTDASPSSSSGSPNSPSAGSPEANGSPDVGASPSSNNGSPESPNAESSEGNGSPGTSTSPTGESDSSASNNGASPTANAANNENEASSAPSESPPPSNNGNTESNTQESTPSSPPAGENSGSSSGGGSSESGGSGGGGGGGSESSGNSGSSSSGGGGGGGSESSGSSESSSSGGEGGDR